MRVLKLNDSLMCSDIFIYSVYGDGAHTKHLHSLYVLTTVNCLYSFFWYKCGFIDVTDGFSVRIHSIAAKKRRRWSNIAQHYVNVS